MDPISLAVSFLILLPYLWVLYNIPILAVGIKKMHFLSGTEKSGKVDQEEFPKVSIVVPVRDEEKVIGRLLEALVRLTYPLEKLEIIIVEDSSKDRTIEICRKFAEEHSENVRFYHRSASNGKPSALNFGFRQAHGGIVAVFDADNVPQPDVLLNIVKYFEDSSVAAVQGTTCIINADENMLTKFLSYEEAVWLGDYLQGKDSLNLFVPLTGSCLFVRKEVAERVGGWNEGCLAEDLEMSAKITEKGYNIKYAPEVMSWQEAPSSLTQLAKQRIRWFRGYMEVAAKYSSLLRKMEMRSIDAEITFMGPFVLTLFFMSHFAALCVSCLQPQPASIFTVVSRPALLLTAGTLLVVAMALIYATKPRSLKNALWLPFVYAYLSLQGALATYAFLQIMFKRPRRRTRTPKTGRCTQRIAEDLYDERKGIPSDPKPTSSLL